MRRWMFLLLCLPIALKAQTNRPAAENQPPFRQFNIISPFPVTLVDGKTFTKNDLKKNKPVILFLFSVECDHCMHMTEDILKNINKFKNVQLYMVTPFKFERMKAWYDQYKIGKYPNIVMGADPTRQFPRYYDLKNFPGVYIYNKKHQLVADYEGSVKLDTMLKHL